MSYRRELAIFMMVATVVVAACNKEKNDPGMQPDEKITKIYEASILKIEMKNPVTGEWTTKASKTTERRLAHEFAWEGDRIESVTDHNLNRFYSFNYDDHNRISHIYCDSDQDYSRALYYDEEGLLSRSEGTNKLGDGTLVATQKLVFTWADGVLQKIEEESWSHFLDEEVITTKGTYLYTWEGGNVVKSLRQISKNGGQATETEYTYEYTSSINPLHGFVLSMIPYYGIFFDYDGIDGLSKNLPSRIVAAQQKNRYEYSYTGNPVSKIEKHEIADGSLMLRQYVDYTLDVEYAQ